MNAVTEHVRLGDDIVLTFAPGDACSVLMGIEKAGVQLCPQVTIEADRLVDLCVGAHAVRVHIEEAFTKEQAATMRSRARGRNGRGRPRKETAQAL